MTLILRRSTTEQGEITDKACEGLDDVVDQLDPEELRRMRLELIGMRDLSEAKRTASRAPARVLSFQKR